MGSIQETADIAVQRFRGGNLAEAWSLACEVLKSKPDHAQARELLMAITLQTSRHEEALAVLREAANARRSVPELQEAIAFLLIAMGGRAVEAEKHLRRALAVRPGSPATVLHVGLALAEQGRHGEATDAFRRACQIDPTYVRGWFNLGMQLVVCDKAGEAVDAYRTAAALSPRDPNVLAGLGGALDRVDRMVEAIEVLQRAVALGPELPFALTNLGGALISVGRVSEGCELLAKVLEADPESRAARSAWLKALNYVSDDGPMMLAEHRVFGEQLEAEVKALPPRALPRDPGRPLRVGFLSSDLRRHSCARFLEPLFDGLKREGFEAWGLYACPFEDEVTARFKAAASGWLSIAGRKADDAAAAVQDAGIDILIECGGHTAGSRLDICAARPAPVQMTFLGYPNTTGLTRIDYRIVDAITDPPPPRPPPHQADGYAQERLLRLPGCLWCFRSADGAPEVGPSPVERTGRVTIGCFNNLSKVTPDVIRIFAEILKRAPGTTLLFKNRRVEEPATLEWLRGRFAASGVAPERIEAVGWIPKAADHLKVYDRIDFQLDTFPYNGTTTTCESFWQGVPIVALKGRVHAARVSMSLLHAVGLDELVADDAEEYIEKAVALAKDPGRLGRLRREMRGRMEASVLRDEAGYCKRFGALLREAWASRAG